MYLGSLYNRDIFCCRTYLLNKLQINMSIAQLTSFSISQCRSAIKHLLANSIDPIRPRLITILSHYETLRQQTSPPYLPRHGSLKINYMKMQSRSLGTPAEQCIDTNSCKC